MLEGRLNEFGLPDVFQLLAFTHKTGVLRITDRDADGQVHFQEGAVTFAVADDRRPRLAARLSQHLSLSESQHARVIEAVRRGEGSSVCQELITEGVADAVTLQEILREHIQDVVFTLMRLDEGSFFFDSSAAEETAVVAVSGDELVAEGGRRLVEWQRIHERIPAPTAVLRMVANAPRDEPVTLQPEQWRLLALLGGTRTVADLSELSGQGEYATGQVLADLLEADLVEVCDPLEPTEAVDVAPAPASVHPAPAAPSPLPSEPLASDAEHLAPEPEAPASFDPFELALGDEPEPDLQSEAQDDFESYLQPESQDDFESYLQPESQDDFEPYLQPEAEEDLEPDLQPAVDVQPEPEPEPQPEPQPTMESEPEPHWQPGTETPHDPVPPIPSEAAPSDPARQRLMALRQRMQEAGMSTAAPAVVAAESVPAVPAPAPPQTVDDDGGAEKASDGEPPVPVEQDRAAETVVPMTGVPYVANRGVDRASVARELASLGLDDDPVPPSARPSEHTPGGSGHQKRLGRDEEVSKGLLLRLIDGVKGA